MRWLLNAVYLVTLAVAAPWLLAAAIRKGKYREGWSAKLWGQVPVRTRIATAGARAAGKRGPCVWLHAVSVGEVNVLQPLLKQIFAEHPDWQCVISTTTTTGFELARRLYPGLTVFYCPLDFSWAVSRAVRRVAPDLLLLVELELWPNLIVAAKKSGARVAIINGRLSEKSARSYGRIGWLVRPLLRRLDLILVQNDEYAARFARLLGEPVSAASGEGSSVRITGSLKFDGARADRGNATTRRLSALAGFAASDVVWLAGSTQAPEEAMAVACYLALRQTYPQLRLVLVPRHPDRFDEVAAMLDGCGAPWQRRSHLEREGVRQDARILLVDTIGELGAWWGTAQLGFVGGSMGTRGGQNMIEPAAYGVATCFGPNTKNFRDVVAMLLARDAAVVVRDQQGMQAFVARCLSEESFRVGLGQRASQLVSEQLGATRQTLHHLNALLDAGGPARCRPAA